MPKTGTEMQACRAPNPMAGDNGEPSCDTWVSASAQLALERLARHNRVTQRAMLEWLIRTADDRYLDGVKPDSPEWVEYFGLQ